MVVCWLNFFKQTGPNDLLFFEVIFWLLFSVFFFEAPPIYLEILIFIQKKYPKKYVNTRFFKVTSLGPTSDLFLGAENVTSIWGIKQKVTSKKLGCVYTRSQMGLEDLSHKMVQV